MIRFTLLITAFFFVLRVLSLSLYFSYSYLTKKFSYEQIELSIFSSFLEKGLFKLRALVIVVEV